MMTAEQLRGSIIQLAMQGKLVKQRPEEGTGEDLFKEIQTEKNKLIKDGTIKKQRDLPDVREDEIPFDIPETWKWIRIASVWQVLNGDRGKNYPAKSTLSKSGIPFISALNLDGKSVIDDDNLLCMSEEQYKKLGNGKLTKGDVVVCIRGSLGKHGRYPFDAGAIASSLVIMRSCYASTALDDYLMLYLDAPLFFGEIRKYDNGTAQPNLAAKSLEQFLLPLPPLSEQKRIVAKVNELIPFVEQYAEASTKLTSLNNSFMEMMKKSILREAVQGKLVPQDPRDEPAYELLKRIAEEQHRMIMEGRIKKQKALPEITVDEMPFEIPESWEWIRLGDLISIKSGEGLTSSQMKNGSIPVYGGNGITGYHDEALVHEETVVIGRVGFYCGSVHVTEPEAWITDNAFITTYPRENINRDYLVYALQQMELGKNNNATAQPVVSGKKIYPRLFPVPPFAEQQRIVDKIKTLLAIVYDYEHKFK